jgi:hypothetical protein
MKSSFSITSLVRCQRNKILAVAILPLGMTTAAVTVMGQAVISPPSAVANTPPAFPQPPPTESTPPNPAAEGSPFQWGFVTAHPHLSYRFLYGDGIQSTPGQQTKTSINMISLGVLFNVGSHWTLDYTPTQTYYSSAVFKDTLDHSVRILGATSYDNWSFQFGQSFTTSSTPLIETGQQTSEDDYSTSATLGYHFNDRFQLDTNLGYRARYTAVFPDSRETTVGERLHYQFLPRTDTSISLDYGYIDMSSGTDMSYTRPAAQLNWKATDKTTFNVQAGLEHRSFRESGTSSLNTPTFGAGLQFQPFPTTSIGLSASRDVSVAYFSDQITRNTGWQLNIQQRLLQHYYLSAGYSGQKSTYLSTDPAVAAGRDDKNYSFNVRLSTVFFQRANVALIYQNTHNDSNATGFGFNSSQVGFELGYQF